MHISEYKIVTQHDIQPFRIAQISDLHGKAYESIVEILRENNPDYIAITGDMLNGDSDDFQYDFFRDCVSISPSFLSLGNHERKITDVQLKKVEKTGVYVLDNSWIKIGKLLFGGMTSAFVTEWRETQKATLKYANPDCLWLDEFEHEAGFHILLDHHPENYDRITKDRKIELILSGHAHGGQIRIFNQGIYAPHQGFFPKYTSGVYDNRLVVSRGLSNIKPIPRLFNPREVVFVDVIQKQ